jgi:thiamine biosynthesis lipoprotein
MVAAMSRGCVWRGIVAVVALGTLPAVAAELETFAGPAMGTTYRVTLASGIDGMSRGEVHREVERLLGAIDRAANTWRADSDASRFNRAAAGEWVEVTQDLVTLVEIARRVHDDSGGVFDIAAASPARTGEQRSSTAVAATGGMRLLETRRQAGATAIRKLQDGVQLDLGGIGPGYAVDRIGGLLSQLGSRAHLVELGGEVRGWGVRPDGEPWRVRLVHPGVPAGQTVELDAGRSAAVATSSRRPGGSHVDPRSGRTVTTGPVAVSVRAGTCAEADAWAVAAVVLGLGPGADGTLSLDEIRRTRQQPQNKPADAGIVLP